MPYVRSFVIGCDRCLDRIALAAPDRHEAAAQLDANGWLPCPRKGGKLVGLCPRCRPRAVPALTAARATGDMSAVSDEASAEAIAWSVRRLLPGGRVATFAALEREFCRRCGRERGACTCE